jgi:hypothetical protein
MAFLRADFMTPVETSHRCAKLLPNPVKRAPLVSRPCSFGVSAVRERILLNLFPIVELPALVCFVESPFPRESESAESCAGTGSLSFLLKGSSLYTIEVPGQKSTFAPELGNCDARNQEDFAQWFSRPDCADWAIGLLNHSFRHHASNRGLRRAESADQYHFPRTKPKSAWWEFGGRRAIQSGWSRTRFQVTA